MHIVERNIEPSGNEFCLKIDKYPAMLNNIALKVDIDVIDVISVKSEIDF